MILKIITFSFLFILNICYSQEKSLRSESLSLLESLEKLDQSLLQKDTIELQEILHEDLTLGHSNGWIESKKSLLKNLPTSHVKYDAFKTFGHPKILHSSETLKTIRRQLTASGQYSGESFSVDLKILEIWIFEDERWQLLARQSVESDFDK